MYWCLLDFPGIFDCFFFHQEVISMFRLRGNQRFKNINETVSTRLPWILDYCVSVGPYLDGVKDGLQGGKNICEESDPCIGQNGELLIT